MRSLLLVSAALLVAAAPPAKPKTPSEIVAEAPASAWRDINPDNLVVMDLRNGARVVIQLAPEFAPVHVANIRALAKGGWWSAAAMRGSRASSASRRIVGLSERSVGRSIAASQSMRKPARERR